MRPICFPTLTREKGHTQYYQKATLVPVTAPDALSCFLLWAHLTQNKAEPPHPKASGPQAKTQF